MSGDSEGLKYRPLADRLAADGAEVIDIRLSELEGLVGPLPASAADRQFWANARGHHNTRRDAWLGQGYNAFLRPGEGLVRFVRRSPGEDWTLDELRACCIAYRALMEDAEQTLNKSEVRRDVMADALSRRTEGAYEWRMQNISAVLDELGLPWVEGYKPARNVGDAKPTLIALINEIWGRETALEMPTGDAEQLATRVQSARGRLKRAKKSAPPRGNAAPNKVGSATTQYVRDPEVIAWVLEASEGRCEACGESAPFLRVDGEPYLEVHHVTHLADGGPDQTDNAVGVCPNCHRRLHSSADRERHRSALYKRVDRLTRYPKKRGQEVPH